MVSRFAYAAGTTGILANLSLIAMYVLLRLQSGNPADGTSPGSAFHFTGSANDLLGSLSTALMIPVALFLGSACRSDDSRFVQAAGLAAMALFSVGGPLLVLGVLAFEVETTIAMAAWSSSASGCCWSKMAAPVERLAVSIGYGSESRWEPAFWLGT